MTVAQNYSLQGELAIAGSAGHDPHTTASKYAFLYYLVPIAILATYGYVADKLNRRGNTLPILGDSSWWARRAWFWSLSNQDMVALVSDGYQKVIFLLPLSHLQP